MSNSAIRFGTSSMGYKASGIAAYMGILPAILAKREAQLAAHRTRTNLLSEIDEMIFNAFYASRYASTCINERSLVRQDCLDVSNAKVYANVRAYRKAMLHSALVNAAHH